MDTTPELISKKELLRVTGISYGQLYRWKREGIIPEEWFIKQSSYTGQETFFPKEQILSRIHSILDMKGSHSLDELAVILSPDAEGPAIALSQVEELSEAEKKALHSRVDKTEFAPPELSFLVALKSACPQLSEAAFATLAAESLQASIENTEASCSVFFSGGTYHAALFKGNGALTFSAGVQVIASFHLTAAAEFVSKKYILKQR